MEYRGPYIERIKQNNLPSPEQIGELAFRLISFAERHGKLSTSDTASGGQRNIIKVMRRFETPSLDLPDTYLLQNTIGAHIDDNNDGIRRMRILDSLHRKELGIPGSIGVRNTYEFAWTDHQTIDARRQMVSLPLQDEKPMIDVIDSMISTAKSPFRETDAVAVYMMQEIDHVTPEDAKKLSIDLSNQITKIDNGERQYFESDRDYADFVSNERYGN